MYSFNHYFILLFTLYISAVCAEEDKTSEETAAVDDDVNATQTAEEREPVWAVLFPSFSLTVGVLVFYLLSRHLHAFPYTAVMFLIGTLMGVGAAVFGNIDQLDESIRMWIPIDSELLFLVFLPGLIFKDSMGLNVHLFCASLVQNFIFAFPLVLAGTVLTALVGVYIFPYNWSMNLAMTFGSILSATDPVAVAVLMEEVGAPPRIKTHISGEALLNDGSAIVFFSIFVERYLYDLNIDGLGEEVDLGKGVALFFQKSAGGVAAGALFAIGLLFILSLLNRRLSREEHVMEVTATIAVAYLGYYVAEPVWGTSGVIATVTSGLMITYFGRPMISDTKLLDDFWTLVENLLNTILFTLGGVVWGAVIANGEQTGTWQARDWGYLILLYVLLHVIRFILFVAIYPITVRIGLKTCWPETVFQIFSGLRGAVGISLALFLDNISRKPYSSENDALFREETRKVFGMVGGIAFFTLAINGTTAGPLLHKLGLADSTETRKRIVEAYHSRFIAASHVDLVRLLTQPRFRMVNFALVKHHVPQLRELTLSQLTEAVEKHIDITPIAEYKPPYLLGTLPYLKSEEEHMRSALPSSCGESLIAEIEAHVAKRDHVLKTKRPQRRRSSDSLAEGAGVEPLSLKELRILFISVLKSAYETQIGEGELETRNFLAISLQQSLERAADAVSKGEPLQDWQYVTLVDTPFTKVSTRIKRNAWATKLVEAVTRRPFHTIKYSVKRLKIERSLAFMAAHRWAQEFFRKEFENDDSEFSKSGKIVLSESDAQYKKAEAVLLKYDPKYVETVVSHKFCLVLLNCGLHHIEHLVQGGLLREDEAEHFVEEIASNVEEVLCCSVHERPDEASEKCNGASSHGEVSHCELSNGGMQNGDLHEVEAHDCEM